MKQLLATAISSNSIIVLQHSSSSVFSTKTPVRASFREPIVGRISNIGTGKINGFHIHYLRRKWVFAAKSTEPDDAQPEGGGDSSSSTANSFLEEILQEEGIIQVVASFLSTLLRLPWGSRSVIGRTTKGTTVNDPPLRLPLFDFDQKTRVAMA